MNRRSGWDYLPQPTVQRITLEEQVYRTLRREILEGRLKGGQRLVQDELASKLGTSRIPIRGALKMLASSGLVSADEKGFYSVATFKTKDIEEIYGIRALLEPYAALHAASKISPEELDRLRDLNEQMRVYAESDDSEEWTSLNRQFHLRIYAAGDQPRLYRMIEDTWFGRPSFSPVKPKAHMFRSVEEHTSILRALEERNDEALIRLVRDHISSAETVWSEYLERVLAK